MPSFATGWRRVWWALGCALEELRAALKRQHDLSPFDAHAGRVVRQSDDRRTIDVEVGSLLLEDVPVRVGVYGLTMVLKPGDPVRVGWWSRGQTEPEAFVADSAKRLRLAVWGNDIGVGGMGGSTDRGRLLLDEDPS